MKRLGLAAAALVLLLMLAAGVAAAAWMPAARTASTHESEAGIKAGDSLAVQRPLITDSSIFSQFGFCDDDESVPSY